MKRIALFVQNLTVEYSLSVAQGVASYFTQDKDVKLVIAQTNTPNYPAGFYEYQYWAAAELLKADDVDLIMIVTSTYQTYTSPEALVKILKPFTKKPIVSIAVDLPFKNVHYTISNCDKAFNDVVDHLVKVHGCKNIGFLSAATTNSHEAKIRFDAFKKALKNHNLQFDEDNVINGYFIREASYNETRSKYKSKADIKIDSVVSSNDMMAEGFIKAVKELGATVPDDIKVVGFDNIVRSSFSVPSLSTIDQNIAVQGYKAAEIAHKIVSGKNVPRETKINAVPIYRQSCGCIKINDSSFKNMNQEGELVNNVLINPETIEEYTESSKDMVGIYTLIDTIHTTHTLCDFFSSLADISTQMRFSTMAVVLYEEPVAFKKEEAITIPKKAWLRTLIKDDKQILSYDDKGIEVSPHKKLMPKGYEAKNGGIFIIHPIFSSEKQYGYLIVQPSNNKFHIHHVYIKLIIDAIANAYDFDKTLSKNEFLATKNQKLLKNNQELNFQNSIDELTQVLNRRGFMDKAEKVLKKARKDGNSGIVFFADMDGLKKINDTWGHKIGDIAIQAEAKILKEAFRESDVVGRLSGDEFAIVSVGLTKNHIDEIRHRINQLNKVHSKKHVLPQTLSISLGYAEFTPEIFNLEDLLSKADQMLYKEKEIKHSQK